MSENKLDFDKCPYCNRLLAVYDWFDEQSNQVYELGHCNECEITFDTEGGEF